MTVRGIIAEIGGINLDFRGITFHHFRKSILLRKKHETFPLKNRTYKVGVVDEMETRKVLSGLSYFSIFFAGFIFPFIVWLASSDTVTKQHAKKALLSHLIPVIPMIFMVFTIVYEAVNFQNELPVLTIISIVVTAIVWLVVVIYNLIKGVKVLISE